MKPVLVTFALAAAICLGLQPSRAGQAPPGAPAQKPPGAGGAPRAPAADPGPTPRSRPNIILLTVDTLRADHLALYGSARDTMPSLETLARTSVVFDNAVVPRSSTRPSYASILTGLYPYHHGVRSNDIVLHKDLVTLPEALRAAGYHTAAFVSNFILVGELSGCGQGFDLYDDWMERAPTSQLTYERPAPETLEAILKWLDAGPRQPFFLMVNLVDPHGPYEPPEPFRKAFHTARSRPLRLELIPAYQRIPGELNFFDYLDRYDEEILAADDAIRRLTEALKAKGLWDDALVIFAADHGEALGEHGVFFEHHFGVWEETNRVPMLLRMPGWHRAAATKPRRVADLVSPMDLFPTILSYLRLPAPAGQEPFDGIDLLPLLRGESRPDRAMLLEFPNSALPQYELPDIFALRTRTHKLIRTFQPQSGELRHEALFDLTVDPGELSPITLSPGAPLHRRLGEELDLLAGRARGYRLPFTVTEYVTTVANEREFMEKRLKNPDKNLVPLSEEQIELLRSLGYIN